MSDNRYNGWTNYETWLVKLWMDNDEGSYNYYNELAKDYNELAKDSTRDQAAARELADRIKDEYENASSELTGVTGFWADLMGAALSRVNWDEIAGHMVDDIDKSEAA